MTIEELRAKVERELANSDDYFPDNYDMLKGYRWAMEEVIAFIDGAL